VFARPSRAAPNRGRGDQTAIEFGVTAAIFSGITVAAAARQLGVSRSWASREANAPGTRILIAELLEPHREQLNELFRLTLDLIKDAFQPRRIFVVRGVLVDGGPDHYARLEAAKLFLRLLRQAR
jgi:hypothetical protein